VRNNLAKCFSNVAVNLGVGAANLSAASTFATEQSLVMSCFVALLTDVEPEVRAASVGHFARMVHWAGQPLFVHHLQPLLPQLADDVVMEVRSKTALAVMEASQGDTLEDAVILQAFGPLLENFLQDEYPEVQLQVLTNLASLSHLLADMNGVVATLLHMSKASNWRVRQAVATLLPHLAQARGLDYFVSVLLEPTWLTLLLDPVATVRNACVSGMSILTEAAGPEWMIQNLEPHHVRIFHNAASNYLVRMTIVRVHIETAVAASKCASPALWQDVVQKITTWGLNDKVVNVRMLASEGLYRILNTTQESTNRGTVAAASAMITTNIRPALEQALQREEDDECRRSLVRAVEVCSAA
jgi:HEAT repeat protein